MDVLRTEPRNRQNQPIPHLQNDFFSQRTAAALFRTSGKLYLPYAQNLLFSGNIYAMKKYNILPSFASSLEYEKSRSITDFGMVGIVKWPLLQQKNWSIHLNGKVRGSKQYLGTTHQRNRWNFEHQFGGNANYHFTDSFRASLGLYHYRIISDFRADNSAGSYINSDSGIASLRFQF